MGWGRRGAATGAWVLVAVVIGGGIAACGTPRPTTVSSAPPGSATSASVSASVSASDGSVAGSPTGTPVERQVRSKDGALSFRVPAGWITRRCPMAGEDCLHVTPPSAARDEFVNGSFSGMNTVEGSPTLIYCLPGMPSPDLGLKGVTGVSWVTVAGHRALRAERSAQPDLDIPESVSVMVCLDGSGPPRVAWIECSLGQHPRPDLRQACARVVATFGARPSVGPRRST